MPCDCHCCALCVMLPPWAHDPAPVRDWPGALVPRHARAPRDAAARRCSKQHRPRALRTHEVGGSISWSRRSRMQRSLSSSPSKEVHEATCDVAAACRSSGP